MKLGDFALEWLEGGTFELDGGAMFGVVPRMLWTRKYPPIEDNYIALRNSPVLVTTPQARVLIDSGLGNKLSDKQKMINRVTREWALPEELSARGLKREDMDYVILTHCDFDHAGGVVMNTANGPELTFPRAKHIVQKAEWDDAMNPNRRASGTYLAENFTGLMESGNLVLVDGEMEVTPGIRVSRTAGHTRGHQVVYIESAGELAIHMADLLPTHAHFNPLWVMAYDNFPLDAIEQKTRIEEDGIRRSAWFTFYHDIHMLACRFDPKGVVIERFTGE